MHCSFVYEIISWIPYQTSFVREHPYDLLFDDLLISLHDLKSTFYINRHHFESIHDFPLEQTQTEMEKIKAGYDKKGTSHEISEFDEV